MKLDWNLMRTILAHVESETIDAFLKDAKAMSSWKEGQLLSERIGEKTDPAVRVVFRHTKMLVDAGYIEGIHIEESIDGFFQIGLSAYPSLTLQGYSLLESLRTNGFIDKIKAYAKEKSVPLTLETLKFVVTAALPKILN